MAIFSFADQETEKIWAGKRSAKLPGDIQERALRKLRLLNAALKLDDLKNPPGNHLEAIRGDRKGQYSIRIHNQWRICFIWKDKESFDVQIVDYH